MAGLPFSLYTVALKLRLAFCLLVLVRDEFEVQLLKAALGAAAAGFRIQICAASWGAACPPRACEAFIDVTSRTASIALCRQLDTGDRQAGEAQERSTCQTHLHSSAGTGRGIAKNRPSISTCKINSVL